MQATIKEDLNKTTGLLTHDHLLTHSAGVCAEPTQPSPFPVSLLLADSIQLGTYRLYLCKPSLSRDLQ